MNKITKLAIFDFDGTLFNTQTPDEGKKIWKEKTNTDWPHIGWWSKKESLDSKVFNHDPIEAVINEYKKMFGSKHTYLVMLTGRRTILSKEVENILNENGLSFDEYRYNYGGDTLSNKIEQINELLSKNKDIDEVVLFDDRIDHVKSFNKFLNDKTELTNVETYHICENGLISLI